MTHDPRTSINDFRHPVLKKYSPGGWGTRMINGKIALIDDDDRVILDCVETDMGADQFLIMAAPSLLNALLIIEDLLMSTEDTRAEIHAVLKQALEGM